jgi:methoxymalonate biosynthesis acyl carrier protein
MADTQSRIREFLTRHIRDRSIGDDEDIFATGYVNSLFTMQLVLFVEREFTLEVQDEDLERSNFCSVNAITDFVNRKQASVSAEAEQ